MMKDCSPALICCEDAKLRDGIALEGPAAPAPVLFDEVFATTAAGAGGGAAVGGAAEQVRVADADPVTIIYTSGTSGEAKGVVLTAANVGFMLDRTAERLEQLMSGSSPGPAGRTVSFIICPSLLRRRGLRCLRF